MHDINNYYLTYLLFCNSHLEDILAYIHILHCYNLSYHQ